MNFYSVSKHVKKTVEFSDLFHTIYWPVNIAKKQQGVEIIFLYMSVLTIC